MDEKELLQLSDEIVQSLTKLTLGEKPGFLSNGVFKKLAGHHQLEAIKTAYIELLADFRGAYDNASELKRLTDFRYRIVELYKQ
ncbi:MAG: hypothetical protein RL264_365 [Bacteroidota bacterium]|jgi:predicted metal-binding protein